jgi:cob(I)alamin adenosyltransferase
VKTANAAAARAAKENLPILRTDRFNNAALLVRWSSVRQEFDRSGAHCSSGNRADGDKISQRRSWMAPNSPPGYIVDARLKRGGTMVQLTKIYTRGGDSGETSLADGARVAKHDPRVETYGTVDEANAVIGLARLHSGGDPECDAMLARIQNDLFDLGADLSTPADGRRGAGGLRIVAAQVDRLEREIDAMNARLQPLNSFVLPGGTALAAYLHLGRTVVRRAERLATALAGLHPVNPEAIKYLNRLSDHLFVLSRHANGDGAADVLWVPGAHR